MFVQILNQTAWYQFNCSMMKIGHIVVDSCAFLKLLNVNEMAEKVYTCPGVVAEVRDRQARRMLSVLPYELVIKSASPACVKKIIEMSKATGDYRSLSRTDIEVIALTYELSRIHDPASIKESVSRENDLIQMGGSVVADLSIPGFYLPSNKNVKSNNLSQSFSVLKLDGDILNEVEEEAHDEVEEAHNNVEKAHDNVESKLSSSESEGGTDTNDDCVDDAGWITPAKLREMNDLDPGPEHAVKVGCLTQDFAMQNLLKKMNLNVISGDGKLIKSVRSHVLRCHACFEVTKVMSKVFCPKCGNKTLKRVPVELDEQGAMKMFFSRNPKVLNPKGLRYPLPHPRGGKHSNNPILVEDQRIPQNKPSRKSMMRTNVWAENYECGISPFAVRDTESRAFRLGIRPNNQRRSGARFLKKR